jgi:uncharacterized membrane protein (DUF2068 family)
MFTAKGTKGTKDRVIQLIAIFRFAKALLLILAGFGVLKLLNPAFSFHVREAMRAYPFAMRHVPQKILRSKEDIELAASAAFAYAAIFLVEGTGLWMQKTWAEWFTVAVTTSFIPFEIVEIVKKTTALRVALVVANIAIVMYLVVKRLSARKHGLRRITG